MFVCAVFQNTSRHFENRDGDMVRKGSVAFASCRLECQIGTAADVFLKERVKIVEQWNPMMKITLRTPHS